MSYAYCTNLSLRPLFSTEGNFIEKFCSQSYFFNDVLHILFKLKEFTNCRAIEFFEIIEKKMLDDSYPKRCRAYMHPLYLYMYFFKSGLEKSVFILISIGAG